jgi:hypothetical protein
LSLWNGRRYGTYRVHGARKCLTIKLFLVKRSLISFHNIGSPSGLLLKEAAC